MISIKMMHACDDDDVRSWITNQCSLIDQEIFVVNSSKLTRLVPTTATPIPRPYAQLGGGDNNSALLVLKLLTILMIFGFELQDLKSSLYSTKPSQKQSIHPRYKPDFIA
ncbi:hypothetical protein VNO77_04512 [Canavalia gladiata]|uniref:Uncharacterized protein n=1 Tax=Canavalia gladiata TaxID=3824 RepID=A0AAN9MXG6_CANGL